MTRPASSSAALPIASLVLRILIVLNWVVGAGILALLLVLPHKQWILASFKLTPSPDATRLIAGLRMVAVLGLVGILLNHAILERLLAIVRAVRSGEPFAPANAFRLYAIAWALLGIQVLSLIVGAIARTISSPAHPVHFNAGFSVGGWLAVLLTFVLARVFEEGTVMRDDLEGIV